MPYSSATCFVNRSLSPFPTSIIVTFPFLLPKKQYIPIQSMYMLVIELLLVATTYYKGRKVVKSKRNIVFYELQITALGGFAFNFISGAFPTV